VVAVMSGCPPYYRVSPAELAQFAATVKGGLRGIQFWVCLADDGPDALAYALPDTLDVLAIDCLDCGRISDVKSRFETVYPKWLAKANGRPLVLCWDNWQRNGQGLVPTCEAGLFRSIGELAKTQGFAGVTFSTYGPNTFENTTNQGIQTRPELVAEIREIAREWGIERNPSPQAPAPAPPGAASAGWEASVYDFSHASQLTDFKVIAGDWRIEDGCLRCTPKAGEGGNCALLLNRYFEGDLVVEWQQRMSKDPAFTLPADNTDVSAGVELTEELKPGLSYAAVAYADGGWGPRRDHRNRVVVLVRRAREGGGTDRAPGSREVAAGDAIGFDQDQSFRMQVPRADAQKAFTLTGMNWSLENRMAYMLRPRCVWLFCHNCRGEFKNLRIRFLPAVTAGSEPSAATQGKPSGGDAGASQPPPAVAPFDAAKAKEHQQVWAKHLGVPVEVTNSIGMKLALIPPGEFLMGAPDADPLAIAGEKPQHRVRITRAFYMSEYETTQGEFERVMGTNPSGHSPSGRYKDKIAGQQTNRLPVETVSWNESQEFCGKLSEMREEKAAGRVYNLPTEAQCEYACRAGTATRFYFGEVEQLLGDYEWFVGNSGSTPHLVGMKKPNAWGLFDMRGNVWEWCADWYDKDYYGRSPTDDPKGPASGSRRTMRTGHCDAPAVASRSAFRSHVPAGYRSCWGGFRLVCELPRSRAEKAPDPTAPAAASDGGKEVVYDFSQPSQLKDFEVKTGDWRIEDGSLRCTPKAGEAGNCGLLLDRGFDGELEVQWQQRMSKDPGFSLTDENHAVSAGVDLSEGFASEGTWSPDGTMWGLGYVALAYADGGWGPRRDHPNRILLVGRYSRSGGGMEASVESRDLKAGDPIGYDQDQSFRLQLQYPGGQERVTLEGMNWSLENRRVIGLRPRYVSLFCHNCRGQFKNLRIRYRPAQAAATQGKPSGAAVAASPPPAIAPFDAAKAKEHQQAWAKHLGVPVEMTNSIGMKLVLIPPGEFDMGATEQEIERFTNEARQQRMDNALIAGVATNRPQHRVRITKPFYLSAHEVTVGQFASFAQTAGYVTEAEKDGEGGLVFKPDKRDWQKQRGLTWRSPGIDQDATHPVVMVSWNDACAFCAWLRGYRLPTEAEWEYACRAGTTSYWYVGNEERDLRRAANLADETFKQTFPGSATVPWQDGFAFRSPVGRFEPNAFGLYDMHGNVWEWCQDWYDAKYYERSPAEDPTGAASGQSRVIRGGGWILTAFLCRSAGHGDMDKPTERTQYTGFRVVREAGP